MSLPPTVGPLMADMKVEEVVAEKASKSNVDLSSAGRNTYEQLKTSMKSVGMMYQVPFQRLLEAVDLSSENIRKGGHAVICDPP